MKYPDWDAMLSSLVGEILLDTGARKHDDPDGKHLQHCVVAFERRGLGVSGPVGLEGDLRDLAVIGPFGGNALGALW